MQLLNEPVNFSPENIAIIEKTRNAKWVIDTEKPEHSNLVVSIFYQEEAYPETGSHYFGLYKTPKAGPTPETAWQLMITDGAWIEDLKIDTVEAANGDVIFSRYRHDYRTSPDGSVFIDGGRAYTRSPLGVHVNPLTIKKGEGDLY
jgi:hypothetical protein